MSYDVVVVGGGIGGLTVASLLSARGVKTCLLERQSQVGGCVARVEYSQHDFDPGLGIYSGWGMGEIHRKIFAELPVPPPEVSALTSELVVRLHDGTDVRISKDDSKFFEELRRAFPECTNGAVEFYQNARRATEDERRDESSTIFGKAIRAFRPKTKPAIAEKPALDFATETSPRFKSFLDAQLRAFTNTSLEEAPLQQASLGLSIPRQDLFSIKGGPASLAERLGESIIQSGGKIRLDAPVLRLAYDDRGRAIGVYLLSGEPVEAKHAIVSNLTIWDTHGKLVGLNRTPSDVKAMLANLDGFGAFVLFASVDEVAISRLPSSHMLFAPRLPRGGDAVEFTFTAPQSSEQSAPTGKRSATVSTTVEVNDWFRYQSNQEELEEWDQAALAALWTRLHSALPELGADIEVIETSNPRTIYDTTRRKLGMVRGTQQTSSTTNYQTFLPNLFMVGDTVSPTPTLPSVSHSALVLADKLTALVGR